MEDRRIAKWSIAAMLLLIASYHVVNAASMDSATHSATLLADPPGRQLLPRTDGATVVWLDFREADIANPDIYGADLATGQIFPVVMEGFSLGYPNVAQGVVVWEESQRCSACELDIFGMRLATGERFTVAATSADETAPVISGGWVVWRSAGEDGLLLKARDLAHEGAPITLAPNAHPGHGLAVDGRRVVWEDLALNDDPNHWGLFTMEIGDSQPTLLHVGDRMPSGSSGSFGYDVAGDTVVVIDNRYYPTGFRMIVFNLDTDTTTTIDIGNYDQNPTTDGRYVVWEDHQFSAAGNHWVDLRGYDLLTDSEFLVAPGAEAGSQWASQPDLRNGVLVWSYGNDTNTEIDAAPLADRLPRARRPDPGPMSSDKLYFPETGHVLAGGFKTFWEGSGGLPVFGYPLTEEFSEKNPDTHLFYTTQYFERQRYEWHPENADTPYEVLLGRLGAQLLAMQGRDWQDFPTADPSTPYYFPETEHAIDERFYGYWSSHGLEFGDAGVSFRESLALFGYPISEPMLETNADGDTVLTQYFERAVFEYHPENAGTAYVVLLRRVGAEVLAARDWSSSTAMN